MAHSSKLSGYQKHSSPEAECLLECGLYSPEHSSFLRGVFQETLQKIYWSGQAFRLTKRELFSLFLRDTS